MVFVCVCVCVYVCVCPHMRRAHVQESHVNTEACEREEEGRCHSSLKSTSCHRVRSRERRHRACACLLLTGSTVSPSSGSSTRESHHHQTLRSAIRSQNDIVRQNKIEESERRERPRVYQKNKGKSDEHRDCDWSEDNDARKRARLTARGKREWRE
jgi:hypothetical protein